jgi:hypothetical protein
MKDSLLATCGYAASPSRTRKGDSSEALGPTVDAGFTAAGRIELDETSRIEHVSGWLRATSSLFDELMVCAVPESGVSL